MLSPSHWRGRSWNGAESRWDLLSNSHFLSCGDDDACVASSGGSVAGCSSPPQASHHKSPISVSILAQLLFPLISYFISTSISPQLPAHLNSPSISPLPSTQLMAQLSLHLSCWSAYSFLSVLSSACHSCRLSVTCLPFWQNSMLLSLSLDMSMLSCPDLICLCAV